MLLREIHEPPQLTQAAYWAIFVTRSAEEHAIVGSMWARGILGEASIERAPAGIAGLCWLFRDGSGIIAHPGECVRLLPARNTQRAA